MNVPEVFKSEDTIYHYTTLKTAMEFILHDGILRLSNRNKSNDPIEKISPSIFYSEYCYPDDILIDSHNESKNVTNFIRTKIEQAKQLCFCMNDNKIRKINSNPEFPHEYYGFMKPRMWDQYADKYNGVCLAFSLKELKKASSGILNREVQYINYSTFGQKIISIDVNEIKKIGSEIYWNEIYSSKVDDMLFRKHIDYEGENEYRFLSFSESEISIENSLKGIIISDNYSSSFSKEILNNYAAKYKIDLLYLQWDANGIHLETKVCRDKYNDLVQSIVKNNFQ